MKKCKIGMVQFDVKLGDVAHNCEQAWRGIQSLARDSGAAIVVLPEMWSTGFANEQISTLAKTTPNILEQVAALARQYGIMIIGSLPEQAAEGVCNTAYVVNQEGVVAACYRKVHLFSPTKEHRFYFPGREAVMVDTPYGCVGLMLCYDLRFPEHCRSLVLNGAQIIVVMAQWPANRVAHWETLLRARAIENQVFVAAANRCGQDPGLVYAGHSQICSPFGDILICGSNEEANLSAVIEPELLEETRSAIPCLQERVPEAYVL